MKSKEVFMGGRNAGKHHHATKRIKMKIDFNQIDDVEMCINTDDYPDFCDSFVEACTYKGRPATDDELEAINEDSGYVYEQILNALY